MFKLSALLIVLLACPLLVANPMRPDTASVATVESAPVTKSVARQPVKLNLETIWIVADLKVATINNQTVSEGDRVSGFQVKTITADYVELVRGNESRTIYLSTAGSFEISPAQEDTNRE